MAARRRGIPDNLDPLVDTLSNVVGILVIVLVVSQLQLGRALDRVLDRSEPVPVLAEDEDASLGAAAKATEARPPPGSASLEAREAALRARGAADAGEAAALAGEILAALEALPPSVETPSAKPEEEAGRVARLGALQRENRAAATALARRSARAEALAGADPVLRARLPDPQVEHGRTHWILVRHGRVFPVDREGLFGAGSRALQRILGPAAAAGVRMDEYESAALYLSKRSVGLDGFRWLLQTEPEIRVELGWPDPDAGLEVSRLASDPRWRRWVGSRTPGEDFIRFQVWNDSFETYLAVREITEAAGLRAGWTGREADEELVLPVRFGAPAPREGPVAVD